MYRALVAVLFTAALPLAAQQPTALAAGPRGGEVPIVRRALQAAALRPAYAVRLVSDWPQYGAGTPGCVNGGQEVLEGTLVQGSDGDYSGALRRRATIRFCGVHGGSERACALTLTSDGNVAARGLVTPLTDGWSDAWLALRWHTPEGAAGAVVEGDCPEAFNDSLRRMYLGVSHALEFALPAAGSGQRTERLEDYGWIVEIR